MVPTSLGEEKQKSNLSKEHHKTKWTTNHLDAVLWCLTWWSHFKFCTTAMEIFLKFKTLRHFPSQRFYNFKGCFFFNENRDFNSGQRSFFQSKSKSGFKFLSPSPSQASNLSPRVSSFTRLQVESLMIRMMFSDLKSMQSSPPIMLQVQNSNPAFLSLGVFSQRNKTVF